MSIVDMINYIPHSVVMTVKIPDRFEDGLGYLIHHLLYAFRQGLAREYARVGIALAPEEMAVLMLLNGQDGLKQSELSEKLAKDKAVITRILNKLDASGFAVRHHDPDDRRVVRTYMTAKGRRAYRRLLPILTEFIRNALHGINQRDFDTTARVLRTIITNLKD